MISIIGSGRVGSAIAFLTASMALDDIQLINRHKDKAAGHALDISNAIPKNSSISVVASDYSEIGVSDIIVITASAVVYENNRTEALPQQLPMLYDIAEKIKNHAKPDAKILIVTNPVDILTCLFQKKIDWSSNLTIGVASNLDSSRLRYLLSKEFSVSQNEIEGALVLGEHGDSMVPILSQAKLNGTPVLDFLDDEQIQRITKDLREYWKTLRKCKGPSVYGIAKNTYDVIKSIIKNEEITIPASVLLDGQYGLSDMCMGVPVQVNQKGVVNINEINLEKSELDLLRSSSDIIRNQLLQK